MTTGPLKSRGAVLPESLPWFRIFDLVMKKLTFLIPYLLSLLITQAMAQSEPVRIGIVGLAHDHVNGILSRRDFGDIQIVGIAEPNQDLAKKYSQRYGLNMKIVYATLEEMIATTKPEAVAVFSPIYAHLRVVKVCAPLGIHVMVEKPLAVSLAHAKEMIALAKKSISDFPLQFGNFRE